MHAQDAPRERMVLILRCQARGPFAPRRKRAAACKHHSCIQLLQEIAGHAIADTTDSTCDEINALAPKGFFGCLRQRRWCPSFLPATAASDDPLCLRTTVYRWSGTGFLRIRGG